MLDFVCAKRYQLDTPAHRQVGAPADQAGIMLASTFGRVSENVETSSLGSSILNSVREAWNTQVHETVGDTVDAQKSKWKRGEISKRGSSCD